MRQPTGCVRAALTGAFLVSLLAGCSTITDTWTVQADDTYDLWAKRMPELPFVIHPVDGVVQTYDDRGDIASSPDVSATTRRVEVYVNNRAATPAMECKDEPAPASGAVDALKTYVVASLCDGSRVVVSFTEHTKPSVFSLRPAYIAHIEHVLMDGIWTSEAQTPPLAPQ